MARYIYLHDLDPFVIQFTEFFGIRWYGLAYITGFLMGYFFLVKLSQIQKTPLNQKDISNFINYTIMGVILGGRLGFCLFYDPELFFKWSPTFPFWGVLEIHKGGMASHGGIMGLILACILFARVYSFSILHTLDLVVFGGSVGIFLGRIANFINGELYGRVIETKALFGVQFPSEIYTWHFEKSVEKLLSLKQVLPYLGEVKSPFGDSPLSLSSWDMWVTSSRSYTAEIQSVIHQMILMVQKGNLQVQEALSQILPVRYPSQIYQSLFEGLIPLILVGLMWWKWDSRKEGWIAAVWGGAYFMMRIIGEQFREPDFGIAVVMGLTRGQWLSLVGFIGVTIFIYFLYQKDFIKNSR